MIDALIGAIIAVIATSALALVVEVGQNAINSDEKILSPYELSVARSAMVKLDASGAVATSFSESEKQIEGERLSSWLAEKRKIQQ